MTSQASTCFIGIDVSKNYLDIADSSTQKQWRAKNDEKGIGSLIGQWVYLKPKLIVLEATGGLEVKLVSALQAQGLPGVVVNPRQIRDFAKATGQLAKTDAIDAQVIARFASAIRPEVRPFKNPQTQELTVLTTRRRQLIEMISAEKTRCRQAPQRIHEDIQKHIQWLQQCLRDLDQDIKTAIKNSSVWVEKNAIIRSIPGAGPVLSVTLLASVPELGNLNRRQVAALIGVAPLNRDSGKHRGTRSIWGGRSHVRTTLYMATLTAIRFNPCIKGFFDKLIKKGKKFKVAITACMRKLLVTLNAMVKNNLTWSENYVTSS